MLEDQIENMNIKKAIFFTVAFFDIFEYPLTAWEIWKFLYKNQASLSDVLYQLEIMTQKRMLTLSQGYYFFPHKENHILTRNKRYRFAEKKYAIAMRCARIFSYLCAAKLICVCNSLALSNARETSDIDFFIITQKNRIWSTRFLLTLMAHFTRMRRHHEKIQDRICLSFYISEDALSLKKILLKNDIYFFYWFANLYPLYGRGDAFEKFWMENSWLCGCFPNIFSRAPSLRRRVKSQTFKNIAIRSGEILSNSFFGEIIEKILKKFQMEKILKNKKSAFYFHDTRVIVSDSMLKFHENDRREMYREAWNKNMEKYIVQLESL